MTEPGYPVPLDLDQFRVGRVIGVDGKPHMVSRMALAEEPGSLIKLDIDLVLRSGASFGLDLSTRPADASLTVGGCVWSVIGVYRSYQWTSFHLVRAWDRDTREAR